MTGESCKDLNEQLKALFERQVSVWPLAKTNYDNLSNVVSREIVVDGVRFQVQYNPARKNSTLAKVDAQSIQKRPCFLCAANLPAEQEGIEARSYRLLVNPFPIFPKHFTIASNEHVNQEIAGAFSDLLFFAESLHDFVLFYNGPACGASAPDHLHFQACSRGFIPLIEDFEKYPVDSLKISGATGACRLTEVNGLLRAVFVIESDNIPDAERLFLDLYKQWQTDPTQEPMMNILVSFEDSKWRIFVMPRKAFRPDCFFAEGENQVMISPAAVEMGGILITAREEDYLKVDAGLIREIYAQISLK